MKNEIGITLDTKELLKVKLASFPKRIVAAAIDGTLVSLFGVSAIAIVAILSGIIASPVMSAYTASSLASLVTVFLNYFMIFAIMLFVPALYFGFLESSKWQATPGKRLMKLKVIDVTGDRLNFWTASWRVFFGEFLLVLIVGLPILASFSFYSIGNIPVPAWMWQEAGVLESLFAVICVAAALFTSKRQTLLDLATRRIVVEAIDALSNEKLIDSENSYNQHSQITRPNPESKRLTPKLATLLFVAFPLFSIAGLFGYTKFVNPILNPMTKVEYESKKRDLEAKMSATGTVVYASRGISNGNYISSVDLVEKDIEQFKIPQGAILSIDVAEGKTAKYDISTGTVISKYELNPGHSIYSINIDLGKKDMNKFMKLVDGDRNLATKWVKERIELEMKNRNN